MTVGTGDQRADDASAEVAALPGDPRWHRVLAWLLIGEGILCLAFAVWHPSRPGAGALETVVGGVLVVVGAALLALGHRISHTWGQHLLLEALWLAALVMVATRRTDDAKIAWVLPLVLCAMYAAYCVRDRRAAAAHVVAMLVGYVLCAVIPAPRTSPLFVALAVGTVGVAALAMRRLRSARVEAAMTLNGMAVQDPLTGVVNRRGLALQAEVLRASAERVGNPTTVVVIDFDEFALFNATHGHAAGDRLLIETVRHWERQLRGQDILARVGGDQFVLVLPNTTLPDAAGLLERMHRRSRTSWSAGRAQWFPDEPLHHALEHADGDMLAEKYTRGRREPKQSADSPRPEQQQ